jgi:hypothetical protein
MKKLTNGDFINIMKKFPINVPVYVALKNGKTATIQHIIHGETQDGEQVLLMFPCNIEKEEIEKMPTI